MTCDNCKNLTAERDDLRSTVTAQAGQLLDARERLVDMTAERDAAVNGAERVRALHDSFFSRVLPMETVCQTCGVEAPCPTIRALNGDTTDADGEGRNGSCPWYPCGHHHHAQGLCAHRDLHR